ncbi:MAG: hypothetical protein ACPGPF_06585, partial [Pontibacterium sp.]
QPLMDKLNYLLQQANSVHFDNMAALAPAKKAKPYRSRKGTNGTRKKSAKRNVKGASARSSVKPPR